MKMYCLLFKLSLLAPWAYAHDDLSNEDGHEQQSNTAEASAYRLPPVIYLAPSNINQAPTTTIYLHPHSRYRQGATGQILTMPKGVPLNDNRRYDGYGNGAWQQQDRPRPGDGHGKEPHHEHPPHPPEGRER